MGLWQWLSSTETCSLSRCLSESDTITTATASADIDLKGKPTTELANRSTLSSKATLRDLADSLPLAPKAHSLLFRLRM